MRYGISMLCVAMASGICLADKPKPVHLKDRLAEADLVVSGTTGALSVQAVINPPDPRQFVATAQIQIDQVIKGSGVSPGGSITVALARPSSMASSAQAHLDDMDSTPAIWILRANPPGPLPPYLLTWRTVPDTPANIGPYADAFQQAAQAMLPWNAVRLELTIPSQIAANQEGIPATVRVYTNDNVRNTLPSSIAWQDHVYISLEPDVDPYLPFGDDDVDDTFSRQPRLAVLTITGVGGDTIPQTIDPGPGYTANATLMPMDLPPIMQPTKFIAYARLQSNDDLPLVQALPVTVTITPP